MNKSKNRIKPPVNRLGILLLGGFLVLLLLIVCIKLFYLQIIQHNYYESLAINQQTSDTVIDPVRGTITDRNGNTLAISASAYMITMSPSVFDSKLTEAEYRQFSSIVGNILGISEEKIFAMTQKKTSYTVVARRVEESTMLEINDFMRSSEYKSTYSGTLHISDDQKRYYPHGNLLSTVLGFVGTDNQGLEGLEMAYNDYLTGTPGKIIVAQNISGTAMPFEYEKRIEAEDGCDIELTVDIEMQYILEKYIEAARVEHNVENRVAGIIMDVKTAEILAITSKPDFDPNDPFVISDEIVLNKLSSDFEYDSEDYWSAYNTEAKKLWKNKICEQYEPGSTFKIITASMALEEGLVSLEESFFCDGVLRVSGVDIHCNKRAGHGEEDLREALANSCNPVFMKLALRIGPSRFYNYITLFGFRDKTGSGLPGEQSGYHYSLKSFNDVELAESGFGQGFKITPIQLISAVCSVANDGYYMQPYIIKQIKDANGNIVVSNSPEIVKQTVSEKTSDILCQYLEYTVEKGKMAYLEGYRIAGKTGTSEKLDNLSATGEADKRIASFIGFAPADDPQICVLVVVDEPNSAVQYGSAIAAPLAKKILAEALDHLNIEPDYGDGDGTTYVTVPHVRDLTVAEAKKLLSSSGLLCSFKGNSDPDTTVSYQYPSEGKSLPQGATVVLITDDFDASRKTVVPSLKGLTAAECNRALLGADLNIRIIGENISLPDVKCVSQSPEDGEEVALGSVVTVTLK